VHGYEYSGYASIMSLISFGFGLTILSLGIISEYIWRAFEITKNKPLYIVKEVLTNKIEIAENE
jgi:dolichol-phosphate mannosyltransferase